MSVLIGGPYDGSELSPAVRPPFVWVGGPARKPKGFYQPSPRRLLYREVLPLVKGGPATYLYAELTHRRCENCRVFVSGRTPACVWCGAQMRATPAR